MNRHVRWIAAAASLGVAAAQAQQPHFGPHSPQVLVPRARPVAGGGGRVKGSVPPAPGMGGGMAGGGSPGGACRIDGASAPVIPGSLCSCGSYRGLTQ